MLYILILNIIVFIHTKAYEFIHIYTHTYSLSVVPAHLSTCRNTNGSAGVGFTCTALSPLRRLSYAKYANLVRYIDTTAHVEEEVKCKCVHR